MVIVILWQEDAGEHEAVLGVARDDGGGAITTALHDRGKGMHLQFALFLFRSMAGGALGGNDGSDHILINHRLGSDGRVQFPTGDWRGSCGWFGRSRRSSGRLCGCGWLCSSRDGHRLGVVFGSPTGIDASSGEFGFELRHAGLCHACLPEIQCLQFRQAGEFWHAGISHLGIVKVQILERREALELIQTRISDSGAFQMQFGEVLERGDRLQATVGHLGAGEVERDDFISHRRQRSETCVIELFGDVQRCESVGFAICRDGHERGSRGIDFIERGLDRRISGRLVGSAKTEGEEAEEEGGFHVRINKRIGKGQKGRKGTTGPGKTNLTWGALLSLQAGIGPRSAFAWHWPRLAPSNELPRFRPA